MVTKRKNMNLLRFYCLIICLLAFNWGTAQTTVNLASQCDCEVYNGAGAPTAGAPAVDVGDIYIDDGTGATYMWNGTGWDKIAVDHDWYDYAATDADPQDITNNIYTTGAVSWGNSTGVAGAGSLATGVNSAAGGTDNDVSGESSLAVGLRNTISSDGAVAAGLDNVASGNGSLVVGQGNDISNIYSLVAGQANIVTANRSIVAGLTNTVSGPTSLTVGNLNVTDATNSIIGGSYNEVLGGNSIVAGVRDTTTAVATHGLTVGIDNFVGGARSLVGGQENKVLGGSSLVTGRQNTLSGQQAVAVGNNNTVSGASAMAQGSGNTSTGNYSLTTGINNSTTGVASMTGGTLSNNDALYSFSFGASNNIAAGHSYSVVLGRLGSTTAARQFVAEFTGGIYFNVPVTVTSDLRMKKEVVDLKYGLNEVMKMRPALYKYKNNDETTHLGFIAQEMNTVVPEVVHVPENVADKMAIRYAELIPVLTNAIQEQQLMIETLQNQNAQLQQEVSQIKSEVQNFEVNSKSITAKKTNEYEINK